MIATVEPGTDSAIERWALGGVIPVVLAGHEEHRAA